MATIKQIEHRTVHQIQSGQVIVDLGSVVKELVENSIDAAATTIDVRFKNQGLDSIEVQDNGAGISPEDYETVALKHHTSKLSTYSDISTLQTFGFRGEALASLCALAKVSVTTCRGLDAPKGARLDFEASGRLKSTGVVAAQKGTTVAVEQLFHNLPVRRRELERNIKREWGKVIVLLNQYACILTGIRFSVSQQPSKGKRIVLFSTKGNSTTVDNVVNLFGAKAVATLIDLDLRLELVPTARSSLNRATIGMLGDTKEIKLRGHVSRPAHGEGRQTPDRQMFYVNGRPCGLPQLAKVFNEVYRSYNATQSPFILADVQLDTDLYDVNVSPDKRTILLHDQGQMLESLRQALVASFDGHDYVVPASRPLTQRTLAQGNSMSTVDVAEQTLRDGGPLWDAPDENPTDLPAPFDSHELSGPMSADCSPDSDEHNVAVAVECDTAAEESPVPFPLASPELADGAPNIFSHMMNNMQDSRLQKSTKKSRADVVTFNSVPPKKTGIGSRSQTRDAGGSRSLSLSLEPDSRPDNENIKVCAPPHAVDVSSFDEPHGGTESELYDEANGEAVSSAKPWARQRASQCSKHQRAENATVVIDSEPTVKGSVGRKRLAVAHDEEDSGQVEPIASRYRNNELIKPTVFGNRLARLHSAPSPSQSPSQSPREQQRLDSLEGHSTDGEEESGAETGDEDLRTSFPSPTVHPGDGGRRGKETACTTETVASGATLAPVMRQGIGDPLGTGNVNKNDRTTQAKGSTGYKARTKFKLKSSKPLTTQLVQKIDTTEEALLSHILLWRASLGSALPHEAACDQAPSSLDSTDAEERLSLKISKGDFGRMRVVGQFNLGFILAVRPLRHGDPVSGARRNAEDEMFIIDQHASDEKYNFERLQAVTTVQSQRLVQEKALELTALEEEIVLNNLDALEANGFKLATDSEPDLPVGARCRLVALPLSRETTFNLDDLQELICLLGEEEGCGSDAGRIPRPAKVRKMFAMRACRSSVMIGKALSLSQMERIVRHMGGLDKPWNCPHGRPTMRHLCGLDWWDDGGWKEH